MYSNHTMHLSLYLTQTLPHREDNGRCVLCCAPHDAFLQNNPNHYKVHAVKFPCKAKYISRGLVRNNSVFLGTKVGIVSNNHYHHHRFGF